MDETPNSLAICFKERSVFLYLMDEVREITFRSPTLKSWSKMASTIPSLKYSCSGSLLRFEKGNIAMDLSGIDLSLAFFLILPMLKTINTDTAAIKRIPESSITSFLFGLRMISLRSAGFSISGFARSALTLLMIRASLYFRYHSIIVARLLRTGFTWRGSNSLGWVPNVDRLLRLYMEAMI